MKTTHEVARAIARLIRDSLYVQDGSLKPCLGTELNPLWVAARSANIAQAIVGNFDVSEISDEPPPVRAVDWNDPRIT